MQRKEEELNCSLEVGSLAASPGIEAVCDLTRVSWGPPDTRLLLFIPFLCIAFYRNAFERGSRSDVTRSVCLAQKERERREFAQLPYQISPLEV